MSTCCDSSDRQATTGPQAGLTVALAGNPNCGKTTIFNALTGLRQKVANYPGVTVEKKSGRCKLPGDRWIDVIDLPGTYSLISRSPDERVAMEVLRGLRKETAAPDVVVVVVDASNLQRNLYLVSQLIELGRPLVVALNMMDVAERRGISVSAEKLSQKLGVEVIPIVGHKRKGIDKLKQAIVRARVAPMPDWPLPEPMKEELLLVGGGIAILDSQDAATAPSVNPSSPRSWICRGDDDGRRLDRYQAIAERLLIGDHAGDMHDFSTRQPIARLLENATSRLAGLGIDPMQADIEAHYRWVETIATSSEANVEELAAMGITAPPDVLPYETAKAKSLSEKIDQIFVHKVWGFAVFAVIMATLFVSIFWLAAPIMDGIDFLVTRAGQSLAGFLPQGPIHDLWTDGIVAGVGAVVVFVPQIALLFMFLAILEDSGYLARAAFLMDRVLSKVGLHGKSFIPLLSSFACAIPGIMATRTIENRKDRLATIFIAPFMSCSARLPVYTLLIGTFFAAYGALVQAGIMLSLYALGIIAAAGTAWLFKRSMLKGPKAAFILEMPSYKMPQVSQVARAIWVNTKEFVVKAGTTIFCLSVVLWAMTYYPRLPESRVEAIKASVVARLTDGEPISKKYWPEDAKVGDVIHGKELEEASNNMSDVEVASEQLRHSLAGRFGHLIEPLIKPLGYDWKMGVGLVGSFAAREVFVSTMAIVYSAGDEDHTADLQTVMRDDTYFNGKPVWTPLVAISLLIWFVLAMQCMSTLAIVKRETAGWKWPLAMLLYMNGLAYLVCLVVYQVGRMWFV
ncbi:MAG TPA: ferrous iron transport protein B [Tepidisphaeraceae bacterium]|jgi:ferrous iron transport protein B